MTPREKTKEYAKKYYLKNIDKIKKQTKEWYKETIIKRKAYGKKYRKENKEKLKIKNKKHHYNYRAKRREKDLIEKYGINTIIYNELLEKQNYVCAICFKKEISQHKNGEIKRLSVDHDHKTGENRGLLCVKCNVGLGSFKDDTNLLSKSIKYLNSFKN